MTENGCGTGPRSGRFFSGQVTLHHFVSEPVVSKMAISKYTLLYYTTYNITYTSLTVLTTVVTGMTGGVLPLPFYNDTESPY